MALAKKQEEPTLNEIESQFKLKMGHEPKTIQQMLSFVKQNEFTFNYKQINKWWKKRLEAIQARKLYNTDPNPDTWKQNTFIMIYSRSKNDWFPGKIHSEIGDDMLIVKYVVKRKTTTKRIQRTDQNLKSFPTNSPFLFTEGAQCKMYSSKVLEWCDGEIIEIFSDEEGEWLKVKYRQRKLLKSVDVQRLSPDLMFDNNVFGSWDDDIKTMESCDVGNVVYYLRNNVLAKSGVTALYTEKMIGYFFKNQLNGAKITSMEKEKFVENLLGYLEESKQTLKDSLGVIYDALTGEMEEISEKKGNKKGQFEDTEDNEAVDSKEDNETESEGETESENENETETESENETETESENENPNDDDSKDDSS